MLEDSKYFIWNKGDVYYLDKSQFFKTSEFVCSCTYSSCKEQRINKELIAKLVELRKEINEPIHINSAYRCSKKQEDIRKSGISTVVAKKSSHETGDAVDFRPTRMKIKDFFVFCAKKFFAIGTASTYLHVDMRGQDDKRVRRWTY